MRAATSHICRALISSLVLSLALVASGGPQARVQAAVAPCTVQFGMYDSKEPWDTSMSALRAVDTAVGRHSSIVHWYAQWGDPGSGVFSANQPALLAAVRNYSSVGVSGATPLITWEAWGPAPMTVANNTFPLSKIAAGAFDAYIDSWAVGLKAYGGPVMLDFGHEMDGNWYPWGYGVNGNTVAGYIAAFRHVHDRFVAAGASNVQFVWNPNVWNAAGVDQRVFYPGDAYVDWLAIDVYNWGANGGGWASLASGLTAVSTYSRVASLNASKPMMLAEWASVEPVAGDPAGVTKGQWIIDAATAMGSQFTRLRAAIWFNDEGTTWALNSSANALSGAQAAFGGCGSTPPPPPPPPPSPTAPPPAPSVTPSPAPTHAPSPTPIRSPSPTPGHTPIPSSSPTKAHGPSASPKPKSSASPRTAAAAPKSPTSAKLVASTDPDPGKVLAELGLALLAISVLMWAFSRFWIFMARHSRS